MQLQYMQDRTHWVEVDVTVLQGEVLQLLQSHIGGRLYCLQVLLTVQIRNVHIDEWF